MSKIKSFGDVQYLCFQGGGGLGFAYIGAIEALQAINNSSRPELPLIIPGQRNRMIGVSGASAGAIMGLFVALGCSASDLKKLFSDPHEFDEFFDGPSPGEVRAIVPTNYHTALRLTNKSDPLFSVKNAKAAVELLKAMAAAADDPESFPAVLSGFVGSAIALALFTLLLPDAKRFVHEYLQSVPYWLDKVLDKRRLYISNFVSDRGLFPGFAVRKFLMSKMDTFVRRIPTWKRYPRLPNPATMNFAMFRELTGVDFVVTGTNVSSRKNVLFSAAHTPEFPVTEAVGISSCFPLMFKPIFVQSSPSDRVLGALRGLWVDGGLLNNIPIHAFDGIDDRGLPTRDDGKARKLNPDVLGFTLMDGAPRSESGYRDPERDTFPLASFCGDLFATIRVPAEEGQFRSLDEEQQTIKLFTYGLSLFEFSPGAVQADRPLREAGNSVREYFGIRA